MSLGALPRMAQVHECKDHIKYMGETAIGEIEQPWKKRGTFGGGSLTKCYSKIRTLASRNRVELVPGTCIPASSMVSCLFVGEQQRKTMQGPEMNMTASYHTTYCDENCPRNSAMTMIRSIAVANVTVHTYACRDRYVLYVHTVRKGRFAVHARARAPGLGMG